VFRSFEEKAELIEAFNSVAGMIIQTGREVTVSREFLSQLRECLENTPANDSPVARCFDAVLENWDNYFEDRDEIDCTVLCQIAQELTAELLAHRSMYNPSSNRDRESKAFLETLLSSSLSTSLADGHGCVSNYQISLNEKLKRYGLGVEITKFDDYGLMPTIHLFSLANWFPPYSEILSTKKSMA
jgi:hypothetical protein